MEAVDPQDRQKVIALLAGWLGAVSFLGITGRAATLQPPLPQIAILAVTALLALAVARVPWLHRFAFGVDPRVLVRLHVARFVGGTFLFLHAEGRLPTDFAVPGGWGDIVVAAFAVMLLTAGPPRTPEVRRSWFVWNLFGLLDITLVVATGARLGMADPASMQALLEFPMSLIPTFLVPLIFVTHGVLWLRLRASASAPAGPYTR